MLIIRLQRTGAKNSPSFRLVLAEKHRSAKKKALEVLGSYNPRTKDLKVKKESVLKIWLARNIELSPTVRNLLVTKKLLEGKKVKAWRPKRKPAEAAAEAGKSEKAASAPEAKEVKSSESAPAESAGTAEQKVEAKPE